MTERPSLGLRLITERLVLRPPCEALEGPLERALRDNADHLRPFSPAAPPGSDPFSSSELTRQIELQRGWWKGDQGYALYALSRDDESRLVGRVALTQVVRGAFMNAYLGYWIDGRLQGQGLMTEAVRAACRLGFERLGLHRVQAAVMPRNAPSRRVLAKLGFREEGLARRYLCIAGSWEDHIIHAMTSEEAGVLSTTGVLAVVDTGQG